MTSKQVSSGAYGEGLRYMPNFKLTGVKLFEMLHRNGCIWMDRQTGAIMQVHQPFMFSLTSVRSSSFSAEFCFSRLVSRRDLANSNSRSCRTASPFSTCARNFATSPSNRLTYTNKNRLIQTLPEITISLPVDSISKIASSETNSSLVFNNAEVHS